VLILWLVFGEPIICVYENQSIKRVLSLGRTKSPLKWDVLLLSSSLYHMRCMLFSCHVKLS